MSLAAIRYSMLPGRFPLAMIVVLLVFLTGVLQVSAAGPVDDLSAGNAIVRRAVEAAQSGNLTASQQQYQAYKTYWPSIEDGIRAANRDQYRAIEARMRDVDATLVASPPDRVQLVAALQAVDQAQQSFLRSQGAATQPDGSAAPAVQVPSTAAVAAQATTAQSGASVATLIQELDLSREALARGDFAGASAQLKAFETTWPDVEGQVKTRSPKAYSETEDDMGRAAGLLNQRSPAAKTVLDRMGTRLAPLAQSSHYSAFDAASILLREGLEALLVLVALLAVLQRSGNAARRGWIWGGAALGLLLSVGLGIGLHFVLQSVMNADNRELIEGITGLVAAGMLLYVSYWLHSNTSIQGWQRQIHQRTAAALTTGSLAGLALLAFLAIFREGAETVLFFLGMAADISTRDLLTGLAVGSAGLVALGALILVVGVRIPMRPFFAVAGLLVFYLCFKFLGTGIHALQIAGVFPTNSASFLPASDAFGLSPTWQTAVPQLLLLILAVSVVLQGWMKQRAVHA